MAGRARDKANIRPLHDRGSDGNVGANEVGLIGTALFASDLDTLLTTNILFQVATGAI
ncbi:MAG TPA: hypothetical protein VEY95_17460 [Azospirillaceae bacterium]|nr:hypothetical protein [Azospirillaceae bacterium]